MSKDERLREYVLRLIQRGRRGARIATTNWLIDEVRAEFQLPDTPQVVRRLVRAMKAQGHATYTEAGWRCVA